jgi:hypothetical protein
VVSVPISVAVRALISVFVNSVIYVLENDCSVSNTWKTLGEKAATCVAENACKSVELSALTCVPDNAATCELLKDSISVVLRFAITERGRALICAGVKEEMTDILTHSCATEPRRSCRLTQREQPMTAGPKIDLQVGC